MTTSELFKFGVQLKKKLAVQSTSNVVSIFKNFYSSIVVAVDGSRVRTQTRSSIEKIASGYNGKTLKRSCFVPTVMTRTGKRQRLL